MNHVSHASFDIDTDTASVVNAITPTSTSVINSVSTTTQKALTGLGTPSTQTVWTAAKISAQPTINTTISIVNAGAGDVNVVTAVGTKTITAATTVTATNTVNAVISAAASASAVTLDKNVVTDITVGTASASIKNGKAAAQSWTQTSGSTGEPIDD